MRNVVMAADDVIRGERLYRALRGIPVAADVIPWRRTDFEGRAAYVATALRATVLRERKLLYDAERMAIVSTAPFSRGSETDTECSWRLEKDLPWPSFQPLLSVAARKPIPSMHGVWRRICHGQRFNRSFQSRLGNRHRTNDECP